MRSGRPGREHLGRHVAAGAVTVPLTVIDGCGAWQTFAGGGTSVF